jgi:hypothetical protein
MAAGAPPTEIRGAAAWAKGAVAYGQLAQHARPALVDGAIGLAMATHGRVVRALTFRIVDGRIAEIEVIGNPERLARLEVSVDD